MQVVLFDLPKDRLELFKELLQAEMDEVDDCPFCRATYFPYTHQYKRLYHSRCFFCCCSQTITPLLILQVLSPDRKSITYSNVNAGDIIVSGDFRDFENEGYGSLWEYVLHTVPGDIMFVYDKPTEHLILCFNHGDNQRSTSCLRSPLSATTGLLDGLTVVESIVSINGGTNIRRLKDMPTLFNTPYTVGKAMMHAGAEALKSPAPTSRSPVLNWTGEQRFVSETIEYSRVKQAKDEHGVSYTAIMTRLILIRFGLGDCAVKAFPFYSFPCLSVSLSLSVCTNSVCM